LSDFLALLARKTALVDEALDAYLPPADRHPAVIHEALRYSVFAGGKRLRPALTLAAAAVAGCPEQKVLPAACAIELIHTYSLIHDDLPAMDNDDLRRGKPTSHRVFGEAVAILAGDALFSLAFELLTRGGREAGLEATRILQVVEEIAAACGTAGLIGGQVLDVQAAGRQIAPAELEFIHRAKTGALFRAAVRAGAILGGADPDTLRRLTVFGEYFGLAFQITDDLLDVTGDAETLGKPVGSDARNHKHTYVSLFGEHEARRRARQACAEAVEALSGLGPAARFLRHAVQFIATRDF